MSVCVGIAVTPLLQDLLYQVLAVVEFLQFSALCFECVLEYCGYCKNQLLDGVHLVTW